MRRAISGKILESLRRRLGLTGGEDALLTELLEGARSYILAYTRRSEAGWLTVFNAVMIQIAAVEYNRLGTQGLESRREGEISTAFLSGGDYPKTITRALDPYRLIKGVGGHAAESP